MTGSAKLKERGKEATSLGGGSQKKNPRPDLAEQMLSLAGEGESNVMVWDRRTRVRGTNHSTKEMRENAIAQRGGDIGKFFNAENRNGEENEGTVGVWGDVSKIHRFKSGKGYRVQKPAQTGLGHEKSD